MPKKCQPGVEPQPLGDRCTGQCCKSFYLPWTWDEWVHVLVTGQVPKEFDYAEAHQIIAMVRPDQDSARRDHHQYRCIHFDGLGCAIYESRPGMCKDYPYDNPCEHGLLCTSRTARAGRHGRKNHLPVVS